MLIIIGLALTAAAIRIAGNMSESLEVKDWVAAFIAAIAITALQMAIMAVISASMGEAPLLPSGIWLFLAIGTWQGAVFRFLLNLITLAVVSIFLPGISIRGLWGLVIAAILLTALDFAMPQVMGRAFLTPGFSLLT